ncbi:UPF0391 membrane protein [Allostella vacuolata]|nr:UPF0391 membrane protein [Stella vacuolata]
MLYYALVFLVVALIAGLLGFGGVAAVSTDIAQILFFIFLVGFVITLLMHAFRRR